MAPSRRTVLATGAAGLVTAAASANAQTSRQGSPPQPMRPGRGGTDPGPWMALTPSELVQGTLKLDPSVMGALRRGPAPVVPV